MCWKQETLLLPEFSCWCSKTDKLLGPNPNVIHLCSTIGNCHWVTSFHVVLNLLGKFIIQHNWQVIFSELYPYCCFLPSSFAIGSSLVWMVRMTKICQWRLRLSGRKCGGWQTTPASGYACGTSTRLLRSWATCVSSIWAMRNHRPNWSYCNRPLTLYSTWSSKSEVSGCPGRKEEEGKGLFIKIKLQNSFTSWLLACRASHFNMV